MSIGIRNNVKVQGQTRGPTRGQTRGQAQDAQTLVFAHGFGCDQNMWQRLLPHFTSRYRVVTFDHVGSGGSDLSAYDRDKYAALQGYADDVVELVNEFSEGSPVLFVGHSVAAMIGMLADLSAPSLFAAHLMVAPSPCYINNSGYTGGFERKDVDSLLEMLDANYLGWSSSMAPSIMGAPEQPELSVELTNSFCRTDPAVASQFAHVTFLSDNRKDVSRLRTPTLIIQSSEDLIAPTEVGDYLHRHLPHGMLRVVDNIGHCPHMSAPGACAQAMDEFLAALPGRP